MMCGGITETHLLELLSEAGARHRTNPRKILGVADPNGWDEPKNMEGERAMHEVARNGVSELKW